MLSTQYKHTFQTEFLGQFEEGARSGASFHTRPVKGPILREGRFGGQFPTSYIEHIVQAQSPEGLVFVTPYIEHIVQAMILSRELVLGPVFHSVY
jgi:hypothetical protein